MSISAMKQALKEWDNWDGGTLDHPLSPVMEALRQAIERAEQQEHIIDCPRCGHCCPGTAEQAQPVAFIEAAADNECSYAYADGWNACVRAQLNVHQRQPLTDDATVWCDCGDSITQNSGAKCGNCLAAESSQPLTDEEIKALPQWFPSHETAAVLPLIRAIEAAHGIKEKQ